MSGLSRPVKAVEDPPFRPSPLVPLIPIIREDNSGLNHWQEHFEPICTNVSDLREHFATGLPPSPVAIPMTPSPPMAPATPPCFPLHVIREAGAIQARRASLRGARGTGQREPRQFKLAR